MASIKFTLNGKPQTVDAVPEMPLLWVLRDSLNWKPEPSVCVVLAAHGYPGQVRTGDRITGIETAGGEGNVQVFHAGTKLGPQGLETAGGRVFGVTASGPDLATAVRNTYAAVEKIHFDGMHYRRDIAHKGLKRWLRVVSPGELGSEADGGEQ